NPLAPGPWPASAPQPRLRRRSGCAPGRAPRLLRLILETLAYRLICYGLSSVLWHNCAGRTPCQQAAWDVCAYPDDGPKAMLAIRNASEIPSFTPEAGLSCDR